MLPCLCVYAFVGWVCCAGCPSACAGDKEFACSGVVFCSGVFVVFVVFHTLILAYARLVRALGYVSPVFLVEVSCDEFGLECAAGYVVERVDGYSAFVFDELQEF